MKELCIMSPVALSLIRLLFVPISVLQLTILSGFTANNTNYEEMQVQLFVYKRLSYTSAIAYWCSRCQDVVVARSSCVLLSHCSLINYRGAPHVGFSSICHCVDRSGQYNSNNTAMNLLPWRCFTERECSDSCFHLVFFHKRTFFFLLNCSISGKPISSSHSSLSCVSLTRLAQTIVPCYLLTLLYLEQPGGPLYYSMLCLFNSVSVASRPTDPSHRALTFFIPSFISSSYLL